MASTVTQTLATCLHETAQRTPDAAALVFDDETFNYGELAGAVDSMAAALRELGVGPDQRVGVLFPNCPQFVISYFAAVQTGATVLPLHCMQGVDENTYVVKNAQAETLIALNEFSELVNGIRGRTSCLRNVIISGETAVDNTHSFEAMVDSPSGDVPRGQCSGDNVAALVYTSGTTGRPKGAMLTHKNLMSNVSACIQALGIDEDDVFCGVLPLFHSFGATVCMILPIAAGASVVQLPSFSALSVLETLEQYRCMVFPAVPSMYAIMARSKPATQFDLSALRAPVSGGAPLTKQIMAACKQRFGIDIIEGYGPTEASPVVSVNPLDGTAKPGTAGPPLPGVRVKVVDDEFNELPAGEPGELCVKGPNVMKGYWRAPQQTERTIRDGWLCTGDIAVVDDDNYINIVDRKKDMIIVGGMNVYPREVENVIHEMDEVAQAAVVGKQATVKGEAVAAFVQLKDDCSLDSTTVIEHCRQHLASYKVPSCVEFISEFPLSATGKILKRKLRDRIASENTNAEDGGQ